VAGLSRGINAVNQRPWAVPGTDTTRQRSEWPTTTPVHVAVWADRDPSPHLAIFDPRRLLLGIPVIIPGNTAHRGADLHPAADTWAASTWVHRRLSVAGR
jgi:hypothetical protein